MNTVTCVCWGRRVTTAVWASAHGSIPAGYRCADPVACAAVIVAQTRHLDPADRREREEFVPLY